ncbi:MAG: Uma2 family endonuclease [Thermoguttaceae bacterium]|nr:Uma2 family endonuclease [Thermoguttaceae bacterium]
MSAANKTSFIDFDDFCALVREDQKADLIDGIIYMASPDNTDANRLSGWLYTLISLFARRMGLGEVFISRVAFRLDSRNGPEPDIAFARKDRLDLVKRGRVDGPPDLAVEIVSPDSVERDYGKKRDQYERFGIREYWIVDEVEERVTLLRRDSAGRYQEARPEKGSLRSEVLPGFFLRPLWCWQRPLPDEPELLQYMLKANQP